MTFDEQVLNFDAEEAQETALKCIFDILCFHGLSLFEEKPKRKSSQNFSIKSISSEQNSKQRNSYRDLNDIEEELDDDNDKTIIEDDNEILCSESEVEEEEEDSENFITIFTDLLENNLNSESDSIKFITLQGIGKLFILGKPL